MHLRSVPGFVPSERHARIEKAKGFVTKVHLIQYPSTLEHEERPCLAHLRIRPTFELKSNEVPADNVMNLRNTEQRLRAEIKPLHEMLRVFNGIR